MTAAESAAYGRDWQHQAQCRSQYSSYFFPAADKELRQESADREAVAREVCRSCAVQQPCLDLAQELGDPEGIWGGMDERERRRLRRQEKIRRS